MVGLCGCNNASSRPSSRLRVVAAAATARTPCPFIVVICLPGIQRGENAASSTHAVGQPTGYPGQRSLRMHAAGPVALAGAERSLVCLRRVVAVCCFVRFVWRLLYHVSRPRLAFETVHCSTSGCSHFVAQGGRSVCEVLFGCSVCPDCCSCVVAGPCVCCAAIVASERSTRMWVRVQVQVRWCNTSDVQRTDLLAHRLPAAHGVVHRPVAAGAGRFSATGLKTRWHCCYRDVPRRQRATQPAHANFDTIPPHCESHPSDPLHMSNSTCCCAASAASSAARRTAGSSLKSSSSWLHTSGRGAPSAP
jgi:hypothetical protein